MALKWLNKIKFCVAVYLLSFSIHAQESDYTSIYNDSIPNKMEFDVKEMIKVDGYEYYKIKEDDEYIFKFLVQKRFLTNLPERYLYTIPARIIIESKLENIHVSLYHQELLYDSINRGDKKFEVNLITTLIFENKSNKEISIHNKLYSKFYLINLKDTIELVSRHLPEEIIPGKSTLKIEYNSSTNFIEKNYPSLELQSKIKNSIIKNYNGAIIKKHPNYEIVSLIRLWNAPLAPTSIE